MCILFKLYAMHANVHSPFAFFIPRRRNRLHFKTSFMIPKTGTTTLFRFPYSGLPSGVFSLAFMRSIEFSTARPKLSTVGLDFPTLSSQNSTSQPGRPLRLFCRGRHFLAFPASFNKRHVVLFSSDGDTQFDSPLLVLAGICLDLRPVRTDASHFPQSHLPRHFQDAHKVLRDPFVEGRKTTERLFS